jgi:NADH-quinone oxidoreductase subunit G
MGRLGADFAAELPASLRVPAPAATAAAASDRLQRIATIGMYAGDAVLRRTAALQSHPLARAAAVALHPQDAQALGLADGANARVAGVVLPVELNPRVPRGGAWIEAGHAATATLPPYGAVLDIVKA